VAHGKEQGERAVEYRVNNNGDVCEIVMEGAFGFDDNSNVEKLVESLASGGSKTTRLNLSGLEKIDSAGLGMIVLIKDEVEAAGGKFSVSGANGQVKKMLDISRFGQLMTVES
jgi:anti-anti-sigma factor